MNKQPLSSRTKKTKIEKLDASIFQIPEANLDLDFFVRKGDHKFTPKELTLELFGEPGLSMTEPEKVYATVKALEDLEIALPFEFECSGCGQVNPIAVEIAKVMQTEGTPKNHFSIEFEDYFFEFERPKEILDPFTSDNHNLASIGMHIMMWLVGHNQGKDFEFLKLKIGVIIKLAKLFAEQMFRVSFKIENKCGKCHHPITEEFGVSMEDLTNAINDL